MTNQVWNENHIVFAEVNGQREVLAYCEHAMRAKETAHAWRQSKPEELESLIYMMREQQGR